MKRKWFLVPLLVGVLAVGLIGAGSVLAQTDESDEQSPRQSFAARVAAILGLEEAEVQDAFQQARREMENEALQQRLERLVEAGRLTQEQADEYLEWYQSRPDSLAPIAPFGGHGGPGGFKGFGRGFPHHRGFGPWQHEAPSDEATPPATPQEAEPAA